MAATFDRLSTEESGISLVEMMIAIVILGLILGAMATSLTTSLFASQGQERQVQATAQLQQSIEEVHGVAWENAGLCDSAATSYFGGGTYTYGPSESAPIVLLDDASTACSSPLLVPERSVLREGVTFTVETVVTWADDPVDGLGAADVNSTQDLKRVRVEVRWDHRGEPRSVVNETYLAPNALEQPLRTEIEHTNGFTYTYLDESSSLTQSDVYLRVYTVLPQSGVSALWRLRNGALEDRGLDPVGSRGTEWELRIPAGGALYGINHLPNGETLFTFKATDAASGTVSEALDRALFLIEQPGHKVTTVIKPDTIWLDGGVTCPFSITVTVQGALSSDLVSASWSSGPTDRALSPTGVTDPSGASFSVTFGPDDVFSASATVLSLTAPRIADAHDLDWEASGSTAVRELSDGATCGAPS